MDPTPLSARRATLEDVPVLQSLWQSAGLPAEELGQFINEFQVVTDTSDAPVGAAGLLIEGDDALLHSEAIGSEVDADTVRSTLWRRLQIVARNQGVQRLWTQEDAEFWAQSGFVPAEPQLLAETKASFVDRAATWRVLPLMDPTRAREQVDEQFAILRATQLQEAEAFQQRIKLFRLIAWLLALLVIAGCIALLLVLAKSDPNFFRKLLGR